MGPARLEWLRLTFLKLLEELLEMGVLQCVELVDGWGTNQLENLIQLMLFVGQFSLCVT